ncbi:uncharacterized protein LOC142341061 isoform X2 [Convolutriloba macropyga]|uniref:uncharacterized protein LOC142341061 isoform X2 n=1 Tax=Convolutriloba macropyga TaxID=536237 RepID=UPI003F524DF8
MANLPGAVMSLEMEEVEESPVEESTNSTTQSLSNKLSTLKLNRINNLNNENKNMDNTNKATGQNGGSNTGGVNYSDFSFTRADLADAVALLDDGSSNLANRKSSLSRATGNEFLHDTYNVNIGNQNLHTVCRSGDADMLLRLLRHPGMRKKINLLDEDDLSPLHLCAKYNHFKCAKILVQYGASVQVIGYNETTPLHYCAVYRKFKTRNNPMSGSSNNLVDPNHLQSEPPGGLVGGGGGAASLRGSHSNLTPNAFTALNKIAHVLKDEEDNQRKLIFLFAKEAKPSVEVNAKDKYGSTALHMASYKANVAAVRDLIECNADINVSIA